MAFSFLFGRAHGALPLQLIDSLEDLGKALDQIGSGAPEPPIPFAHLLPHQTLPSGDDPHPFASLLRHGQDPAFVQVALLTTATRLAALSSQYVDAAPKQRGALFEYPKQLADFPLASLELLAELAGVHVCTFIYISVYRFAWKTTLGNIFS